MEITQNNSIESFTNGETRFRDSNSLQPDLDIIKSKYCTHYKNCSIKIWVSFVMRARTTANDSM